MYCWYPFTEDDTLMQEDPGTHRSGSLKASRDVVPRLIAAWALLDQLETRLVALLQSMGINSRAELNWLELSD